ncbi:MAG: type III pantothenate kinase [Phycisphaerae bacterium]|nr:type III pantothenate kinase [Phycisphaerae bacterium]
MKIDQIPNILGCDCGNSSIKIGWVAGDIVCDTQRIAITDRDKLATALREVWEKMPDPKQLVAASVNPSALKVLEEVATETISAKAIIVGIDTPIPMEVTAEVENPKSIGMDRLCTAAAAYDKLGVGCIVADFGTAVTVDCVSEKGVFIGGAILPGLQMSADALSEKTALLPRVKLRDPDWIFPRNTDEAIIGGIIYGVRGAVRQLSELYATELGSWPLVIVTGGDAELAFPHPTEDGLVQARVDDLSLRGIAIGFFQMLLKK